MDSITTGLRILDGETTLVQQSDGTLVELEDLGGGGGGVELTNYYTKGETDIRLAFKQHLLDNTPGASNTILASNLIRRLRAGDNVTITQDADGNLLLAATGGSGIPASIATFQSSGIEHKVATTFDAGLTCAGTVTTDIIKSDSYLAKQCDCTVAWADRGLHSLFRRHERCE